MFPIISDLSIFIFEHDHLTLSELHAKAMEYLKEKYGDQLLPCHYEYIFDEAYDIYLKI